MEQEEKTLSDKIRDYINCRRDDRLEKFDKETEKGIKAAKAEEVVSYEQQRFELRVAEEARFKPSVWLTDAASRAHNVHLATHVAKFTYSSAKKRTNIFCPPNTIGKSGFISTNELKGYRYDIAVDDAKHSDVADFLTLEGSDFTFLELLQSLTYEYLLQFDLKSEDAVYCFDAFKSTFDVSDPLSHPLMKQVYWPHSHGYNLLLPLFASSLAQEIFDSIKYARFSSEQVTARKAQEMGAFSSTPTIKFNNLALKTFGGNQPQNISLLNKKSIRGGRAYLLSSAPPTWQSQDQPPLKVTSIFRGPFSRQVYPLLIGLKKFLAAHLHDRSTWEIRSERARRIDEIVDRLIAYGASVRAFPAGWSSHPDCHLPEHQTLWLDPKRRYNDPDFNEIFEQKSWQSQVAEDFSRFLNAELEHNSDIATGDVEFVQWKVLTAQELRLVKDDVEGAFHG